MNKNDPETLKKKKKQVKGKNPKMCLEKNDRS